MDEYAKLVQLFFLHRSVVTTQLKVINFGHSAGVPTVVSGFCLLLCL